MSKNHPISSIFQHVAAVVAVSLLHRLCAASSTASRRTTLASYNETSLTRGSRGSKVQMGCRMPGRRPSAQLRDSPRRRSLSVLHIWLFSDGNWRMVSIAMPDTFPDALFVVVFAPDLEICARHLDRLLAPGTNDWHGARLAHSIDKSAFALRGFDVVRSDLPGQQQPQNNCHALGDGPLAQRPASSRAGVGAEQPCRPNL